MKQFTCLCGIFATFAAVGLAAGQEAGKTTIKRPVVVLIDARSKGISEGAKIKQVEIPKATVARKSLHKVKNRTGREYSWMNREYAVKSSRITLADDTVVNCDLLITADESVGVTLKKVQNSLTVLGVDEQGAATWYGYIAEYEIAVDAAKDTPVRKKSMEQFQGSWQVVSSETGEDRRPGEQLKNVQIVVKGDKMTFTDSNPSQEDKIEGPLLIDPETRAFDWRVYAETPAGTTMLGIFELKGDDLKIHFGVDGLVRPTTFEPEGWLLVLKRDKR